MQRSFCCRWWQFAMPELCEKRKEKDIIMNVRHKTGEINVKISVWGKQNYNWYWIFFSVANGWTLQPPCCTRWWNKSRTNIWKLLGRENRLKIVLFGSLHLTVSAMKFVCADVGSTSERQGVVVDVVGVMVVGLVFYAATCSFFNLTWFLNLKIE